MAKKYGVSINTVKSWKQRYKWNRKNTHTKKAKELLNNNKLTDKQKLFCIYYIKYFNATKAYQKAYKCDYLTANTNGPRLLVNACIKKEIQKLKKNKFKGAFLEEEDIELKIIEGQITI